MIEIKTIIDKNIWQSFEEKYQPPTFLQSWEWGQCQELLHNKIFRFGVYDNGELSGIAFVYKIEARRGTFLFCPHGPLIDWNKPEHFSALLAELKKTAVLEKADFIRISPLAEPSDANKNLFKKFGFRNAPIHMMHPELSWLLDLSPDEEKLFSQMEKRTRYSLRKAEKDGIKIIKTSDLSAIDKFYALYEETATRQSFVPFSREYVKKEFEIFAESGKILLYFAYYKNEPIVSAMVIYSNISGFYHHGASTRKYSNITAAELVQWEAIKEAKNRGLSFYNFWGIAPENTPSHPWYGVTKFKKGFGGFSQEYLHAQDLPLTAKYWLNFIIEKARTRKRGY